MKAFLTNKILYLTLLIGIMPVYIFAQDTIVNWQTFENVRTDFETKQKPIMVFLYEENDEVSGKMFDETFSNEEVINYINILFYNIKFDVKTNDTIEFFNGTKFSNNKGEKYHSLAKELSGDSISTPSLIMFNKYGQGRVFYGFKNRDTIFSILIYYAEEVFRSTEFEDWEEIYFKAYPPGQKQIMTRLIINWQQMSDVLELMKEKPKPIIIDLYDNYNVSATVMRLQTYNLEHIANYLNSKYYRVTVGLRSQEEFEIKGVTYKNGGEPYNYHQFPYAVLQGNLQFPAFVILDEEYNLIERIQYFMTPENFEPLIHFYGDGAYKNQDYKTFLKEFAEKKNN